MKQQFTALILFMSLIYATTSIAQNYQNVPVFYRANADNIGLEDGEEVFRVRSAWLNRLKDGRYNQIEITIPSSNGVQTLKLKQRQIAPTEGITVTTASGQSFIADPGVYYYGKIQNSENSTAIVSVSPRGSMYVFLQEADGSICEIAESSDHNNQYLSADFKNREEMICPLSKNTSGVKTPKGSNLQRMSGCSPTDMDDANCANETFIINVFYEFDHISYIDEGRDIQNCIDWITDTHGIVNLIYDNIGNVSNNDQQTTPLSSGIDLLLSGIFIWDHPDPYLVGTDLSSLQLRAQQFRDQRPTFNGDIAHLINKGIQDLGGWANIDPTNLSSSLCRDEIVHDPSANVDFTVSPHCVSYVSTLTNNQDFIFSYGTALVAHEMGHLLGGRHTHEPFWYEDNNGTYSVETICNPSNMTNSCTHTDQSSFDVTIMNNGVACWGPALTQPSVDYSSPFHKQNALTMLNNLCDFTSCYDPPNCSVENDDLDLDGFCDDEDCDNEDPTVPGLVGTSCNDNDKLTINDIFIGEDGEFSCECMGTPWSNPEGQECNLIVGGKLTFDNNIVGNSAATWYGGYNTTWQTPPVNTPDIGNALVNGTCQKFLGLQGNVTSTGLFGPIEGIVIPLAYPIPCNTGNFRLKLDYSLVGVNASNISGNLLCIQGSQGDEPIISMTTCGNTINPLATDLMQVAPILPASTLTGPSQIYVGTCDQSLTFSDLDLIINNDSDVEIDFLYLSLNLINVQDWVGAHEVFIDNIEVELLEDNYAPIDIANSACTLEEVIYSPFCNNYEIQYFDDQNWITVDKSLYNVSSTQDGRDIEDRKVKIDQLSFTPDDCRQYRVIQNCPPFSSETYCFSSGMNIPFSCMQNDLDVNLIPSPSGEICIGESVILFDPNYNGGFSV